MYAYVGGIPDHYALHNVMYCFFFFFKFILKIQNMKTKIFLFSILLNLFSCGFPTDADQQREVRAKSESVNGYRISIIEYDSCEYLISGIGYSQMMTHKGNCKYCEKRHFLK